MYASKPTVHDIQTDPRHFYDLTRSLPNSDYAPAVMVPDHPFEPEATLDSSDTRIQSVEFESGESETATVYYEPRSGILFAGDLVASKATPALLEGHSCDWLLNLDKLSTRFPTIRAIYPGHGAPAGPELIDQQRTYITQVRSLVRLTIAPTSPGGAEVTDDETASVLAELDRSYPSYPSVASLPTLAALNVQSVANEERAEDINTLPPACQK